MRRVGLGGKVHVSRVKGGARAGRAGGGRGWGGPGPRGPRPRPRRALGVVGAGAGGEEAGGVLAGRGAEQAAIFAAELGGAVVTDGIADRGDIARSREQFDAGPL